MRTNKKYFFMGGLPRSGSTLLCSILGQNPEIYTSGISVVAGVLWNNYHMFRNETFIQYLSAQNREDYINRLMRSSIDSYYEITDKKYVIDKSRTWTLNGNKFVLEQYIDDSPKIIATTRNAEDIFISLANIHLKNYESIDHFCEKFWNKESYESIDFFKSYAGIMSAYLNNVDNTYIFVDYLDIVNNTEDTLKNIYEFLNIDFFNHDLENIQKPFEENDLVWGIEDLHYVRPQISIREKNIDFSEEMLDNCRRIQQLADDSKSGINLEDVNAFIDENARL